MFNNTTHHTMAGGIQPGTVATDAKARKLDNQCKKVKDAVFAKLSEMYPELTLQRKLSKDQIPGGVGACEPDGGAWFYKGVLIAVFEGKKQQDAGNAIERWFKNNYICKMINPNVSYVTFCIGEGAHDTGVIGKALNIAHLNGFNEYFAGMNSAFMSIDGFTHESISDTMIEVLTERIDALFSEEGE